MRRGAATLLLFRLAVSNAQSRWCAENQAPTAAAYNCGGRVGMVCPSTAEYAEWEATGAASEWAGYEMVACTEAGAFARPGGVAKVVRRCDGENDCIADGDDCRVDPDGVATCSSDETGCGGLVDQVVGGTVIEEPGAPIPLSMGNSIDLMVGSSLQSNWMVPYARQQTYTYAMCVTYGEIADTEVRIATQWCS
eukprot:COSAG02_NODE_12519_length_1533_cov_3.272664_3_plen_194_part_00